MAEPQRTSADRAAVDVGTNSVRLLVQDAAGRRVERRMTITRLGRGIDETGQLHDEALERTLDVLASYRRCWERLGVPVDRVRIAATSAVRDAADRDRFLEGVVGTTGVRPDIVTGEQEAGLAFRGAVEALDPPRPAVVLDVGGGSTELVVGEERLRGPAAAVSLQLGSVRLTERLLADDPALPRQVAAAEREVSERLDEADERLGEAGVAVADGACLIGVAGTVTTMAALHLGLATHQPDRVQGTAVPAGALRRWTDRLVGMTAADRAGLGPVREGRADVIAGGALIVAGVVDRYGFDELIASEADSLDGLAASVAAG